MRRIISSVAVSVLLGGFTGAAAQLPPDILADSYLLQAEQAVRDGDLARAQATIDKILDLPHRVLVERAQARASGDNVLYHTPTRPSQSPFFLPPAQERSLYAGDGARSTRPSALLTHFESCNTSLGYA